NYQIFIFIIPEVFYGFPVEYYGGWLGGYAQRNFPRFPTVEFNLSLRKFKSNRTFGFYCHVTALENGGQGYKCISIVPGHGKCVRPNILDLVYFPRIGVEGEVFTGGCTPNKSLP